VAAFEALVDRSGTLADQKGMTSSWSKAMPTARNRRSGGRRPRCQAIGDGAPAADCMTMWFGFPVGGLYSDAGPGQSQGYRHRRRRRFRTLGALPGDRLSARAREWSRSLRYTHGASAPEPRHDPSSPRRAHDLKRGRRFRLGAYQFSLTDLGQPPCLELLYALQLPEETLPPIDSMQVAIVVAPVTGTASFGRVDAGRCGIGRAAVKTHGDAPLLTPLPGPLLPRQSPRPVRSKC